jgi:hypothetical protein
MTTDRPLPPLSLNAAFRKQLETKVGYERAIKALRDGEKGEDYQPDENLFIIPPDVSAPELPLSEVQGFAQRFGWPHERITLYLCRTETDSGALSSYLCQTTLQPWGGASWSAPAHAAPPPAAPPQAAQQAQAQPQPQEGLSEIDKLSVEITKLAALAAGNTKGSLVDRLLRGDLQPEEVWAWIENMQRFAKLGKLIVEQVIGWVVPLVIQTAEKARADAQAKRQPTQTAAPRSPEAAPPPA